ncbi:MAG: GGDEF domain-containing protein, partial [Clostridia bacterium]|nr:GGDEF domain-containing protein [Clostridia bacterium]
MPAYFLHYLQSNAVCLVIFGIMLGHNLLKKDRTERQIKFNLTLIAFMSYFAVDTLWAGVISGVLPNALPLVLTLNFLNYIIMVGITFAWLRYALAVEEAQDRDKPIKLLALLVPFILATLALIVNYIVAPGSLFDESNLPRPLYSVYLVAVPIVYIAASLVYSLRRVKNESNAEEKRKHLRVGLFPLIVIVGGLAQIFLLDGQSALFCSCCTVFMLIFYIQAMEKQISIDPLTGLNNRGQLARYISQSSGSHKDGATFILMIDVNDFKRINDTFGHAEGDRALVIVADVTWSPFGSAAGSVVNSVPPKVSSSPYALVASSAMTLIGIGVMVKTPGSYDIRSPKTSKPEPVRFESTIPYLPTGAVAGSTTSPTALVKETSMEATTS